jgi:hypothetical protein
VDAGSAGTGGVGDGGRVGTESSQLETIEGSCCSGTGWWTAFPPPVVVPLLREGGGAGKEEAPSPDPSPMWSFLKKFSSAVYRVTSTTRLLLCWCYLVAMLPTTVESATLGAYCCCRRRPALLPLVSGSATSGGWICSLGVRCSYRWF